MTTRFSKIKKTMCAALSLVMILPFGTGMFDTALALNEPKETQLYEFFDNFEDKIKEKVWDRNSLDGYYSRAITMNDNTVTDSVNLWGVNDNSIGLDTTTAANSRAALLGKGATLEKYFGRMLDSGKVHISYDLKAVNNTSYDMNTILSVRTGGDNHNPGVYNGWLTTLSGIDCTTSDKRKVWLPDNFGKDNAEDRENGIREIYDKKYHKYDIWIDYDNNTVSAYMDGTVLRENQQIADGIDFSLKGLQLNNDIPDYTFHGQALVESGEFQYLFSQSGYVMVDNLLIDNYALSDEKQTFGGIKLYSDGTDKLTKDGGEINLIFGEYMNMLDVDAKNYQAKNLSTGEIFNPISVQKVDNSTAKVKLTFGALSGGKYELSYIGTNYGECSESDVTGKVEFTITSAQKTDLSQPYYYMNEDFNDYSGGRPAGWQALDEGYKNSEYKYTDYVASARADTNTKDNSSAMKMERLIADGADKDMEYYYPFGETMTTEERAVVEFDVKHKGGGWTMGLVQNLDAATNEYDIRMNTLCGMKTGGTTLNANTKGYDGENHSMTKNSSGETIFANENSINKNTLGFWRGYRDKVDESNSSYGKYVSVVGNLVQDEWTHIKAEINFADGTYKFTIGDSEPVTVKMSQMNRYRRGNYHQNYLYGIAGLRFTRLASTADVTDNSVSVDNIKVYKPTSYNADRNYNSAVYEVHEDGDEDAKSTISNNNQWWLVDTNRTLDETGYAHSYMSDEKAFMLDDTFKRAFGTIKTYGKGDGDQSVKLKNTSNVYNNFVASTYLDRPLKAGKNAVIEFDALSDSGCRWYLYALNKENMNAYSENSTTGRGGAAAYWYNNYIYNKLLGFGKDIADGKGSLKIAGVGVEDVLRDVTDSDGNPIKYDVNKWYHYRLFIEPQNKDMSYITVEVTDKDSNTTVTSQKISTDKGTKTWVKNDLFASDIYGIGLGMQDAASNSYAYFDNLKVYQADENGTVVADNPEILGVTVNNYGGKNTRYSVSDSETPTITTAAKSISVDFSYPIADSVDTLNKKIGITRADSTSAVEYTTEISADKKTVTFAFSDLLAQGTKLNLFIKPFIGFEGVTGGSRLDDAYQRQIIVGDGSAETETAITDFNLYQLEPATDATANRPAADAVWVKAYDLSKITDASTQLKLVVKGVDSTKNTDFFVIGGWYADEPGTQLKYADIQQTFKSDAIDFTKELTFAEGTEISAMYKAFLWNTETMKPWTKNCVVKSKQ